MAVMGATLRKAMGIKEERLLNWTVGAAFFFSGAAALIYQSSWQRMLVAVVGADLESVTLVVSVFMAGLGVGAWHGGRLADRFPRHCLWMFCGIELGIGLFGVLSPALLDFVAPHLALLGRVSTALVCFSLLLLPTACMGATLPILITHSVREHKSSIGASTARLYFLNTLGAALGALSMSLLLLHWGSLIEAIQLAAALNLCAALGAALILRSRHVE